VKCNTMCGTSTSLRWCWWQWRDTPTLYMTRQMEIRTFPEI